MCVLGFGRQRFRGFDRFDKGSSDDDSIERLSPIATVRRGSPVLVGIYRRRTLQSVPVFPSCGFYAIRSINERTGVNVIVVGSIRVKWKIRGVPEIGGIIVVVEVGVVKIIMIIMIIMVIVVGTVMIVLGDICMPSANMPCPMDAISMVTPSMMRPTVKPLPVNASDVRSPPMRPTHMDSPSMRPTTVGHSAMRPSASMYTVVGTAAVGAATVITPAMTAMTTVAVMVATSRARPKSWSADQAQREKHHTE